MLAFLFSLGAAWRTDDLGISYPHLSPEQAARLTPTHEAQRKPDNEMKAFAAVKQRWEHSRSCFYLFNYKDRGNFLMGNTLDQH